jgi:hypothetical protein
MARIYGKEESELMVFVKAKDLIKYTFDITDSRKFPKKARFTFVNRLQDKVLAVYERLLEANEIFPKGALEKEERRQLQVRALTGIKQILFLIELSFERQYITSQNSEVWTGAALDVKYLAAAWMKKDSQRF